MRFCQRKSIKDAAPNYEGCIRPGYLFLVGRYPYTFEGLKHVVGAFVAIAQG